MKQSTMEAYAEVDSILNLMDSKYILEIPKQLREMFKNKKSKTTKKQYFYSLLCCFEFFFEFMKNKNG